jgi:hypothetical protein
MSKAIHFSKNSSIRNSNMGGKIEFRLQGGDSEKTCCLSGSIQKFGHVLHVLEPALSAMLAFDEATLLFASSQGDLLPVPEASPTLLMLLTLSLPRLIQ